MHTSNISSLDYSEESQDSTLNRLYQHLEHNFCHQPSTPLSNIQKHYLIDLKIDGEDLEKNYRSDDELVMIKSKRIKKRKMVFTDKQEQCKKKRMKTYIETLQNKIIDLQTENEKLAKVNQINIEYIKRLGDSEQITNGFFIDRKKIFQRLQKLTEDPVPDTIKIQIQMQTIIKRQGVYGKQRLKAINYYFKQCLHLILPNIQKYICEAATNQTDIFNPNFYQNRDKVERLQFLKQICPNDEMVEKLLQERQLIVSLKRQFNDRVIQFYNTKCQILELVRKMEKICEDVGQKATPLQRAKFLCYAEQHKQEQRLYAQSITQLYNQLDICNKFTYDDQRSNINRL